MPAAHSGCTGSSALREKRSCVQSQGLLFLLAQLKERGRDTKEWTWGEQDRTEEAHQPRNRNCIYSFMWGVITGAVPEPNKRTSGSVCFWPNHQKQNPFPLAGPVSTAQPWHSPKDFLHWHLILFTDQSGTSKGWSFWFSLTVFISFYTQQITSVFPWIFSPWIFHSLRSGLS